MHGGAGATQRRDIVPCQRTCAVVSAAGDSFCIKPPGIPACRDLHFVARANPLALFILEIDVAAHVLTKAHNIILGIHEHHPVAEHAAAATGGEDRRQQEAQAEALT